MNDSSRSLMAISPLWVQGMVLTFVGGFAVTGTGGGTAFSSASAMATLTIKSNHQPPAWSGSGAALPPGAPNVRVHTRLPLQSHY